MLHEPNYQRLLDAVNTTAADMTEGQMLACPEGKWCAAKILEHLLLAFTGTSKMMQRCLDKGQAFGTRPTLQQRAIGFVLFRLGYFPSGRDAPKMVVPTGELSGHEALGKMRAEIPRMDELHAQCVVKFGNRVMLADHPILGPLRLPQWSKLHLLHTLHHMKQIERLKSFAATLPAAAAR